MSVERLKERIGGGGHGKNEELTVKDLDVLHSFRLTCSLDVTCNESANGTVSKVEG